MSQPKLRVRPAGRSVGPRSRARPAGRSAGEWRTHAPHEAHPHTHGQVSRPFYDEGLLRRYRAARFGSLPPHVFAIAEAAYEHICAPEGLGLGGGVSQAVLVSGESGAGKTEAVKIMMNYLAVVSSAGPIVHHDLDWPDSSSSEGSRGRGADSSPPPPGP